MAAGVSRAEANELIDLSEHAYNEALARIMAISATGSSGTVMMSVILNSLLQLGKASPKFQAYFNEQRIAAGGDPIANLHV
jgi:hypothetical protein